MINAIENNFELFIEKYGSDQYQEGDLYIPKGFIYGCICLFHGGFWKMPYDRSQMDDVAKKIAQAGFVVWNIEYRRTGYVNGGYPGTFDDAVDSVNKLIELKNKYSRIILNPLYLAGHSAGGQLALWLGKKGNGITKNQLLLQPAALIGLAPMINLRKSFESNDGNGSVLALLKSTPQESDEKYRAASPIEMLPMHVEQIIIHGTDDEVLPINGIDGYVQLAKKACDKVEFIKINNGRHMDFTDPSSKAINCLINWLTNRIK